MRNHRIENVALAFGCGTGHRAILSALAEDFRRVVEVIEPAGVVVPYHTHRQDEIIIVVEGRVQFNVEEELVLLQKGEMITIRSGAIHASAPVDGRPARLLIAYSGDRMEPASEEENDPPWES